MSVFFMDFDMAPSVIWARDLYDQMQIRSDFRKWFPRMCQYGFVEGRDYEFVPRVRPQDEGGRTVQRYVKDYRITLEMAKQLYKLHHFHKNDCFRSCEGQHCMGTDHWMQAVIELLHQHKCKSHSPPKRFYESQPPDSLVTTTQIAKEYGCGAKVFNRLLHLHGIQYRANNQWVLYAVCLEGSLKLKEISYIHSEAYAAGELKHGTISLIEQGTLVIGVLTQSELYEKTISNMLECKSRGAYLMGLTTYGNYEIEDQVNFTVYVPKVDEHFVGSLAVIPLQLLGYYVSVAKGLDVDKPRNLAKSVTVE